MNFLNQHDAPLAERRFTFPFFTHPFPPQNKLIVEGEQFRPNRDAPQQHMISVTKSLQMGSGEYLDRQMGEVASPSPDDNRLRIKQMGAYFR